MAPVGTTPAIRSVAPAFGAAPDPEEPPELELAPPHAVTIAPSSGIEIPMIEPRRRNSRIASRAQRNWPVRFTPSTKFH